MRKAKFVKIALIVIGYTALAIRAEDGGTRGPRRSGAENIAGFASAAEQNFAGTPEPGTLGMMGLGLIAMAVGMRRKS
ncbi:MAG: PEP-CTERM sorting domain-containing protein [Fibrobacteria bacterium]